MFTILADECINTDIVLDLRKEGIDVLTVKEAGLTGSTDDTIFEFAAANKRILLSFDRGFGDIFRFDISHSQGVVVVLVGQMSKKMIVTTILNFIAVIKTSAADLRGILAILGRTKARIIHR